MRALKFGMVAAAALISVQAFGTMTVQITNNTNNQCVLDHYNLKHGSLFTLPPKLLAAGDDKMFTVNDSNFIGA